VGADLNWHSCQLCEPQQHFTVCGLICFNENVPFVQALDRFQRPNLCTEGFAQHKRGELEEILFCSIINHLGKLSGESWSVSESSDPGHDLFVCRLVDGVLLVLILMIIRKFSTVSPHTRHGVPTRDERAQVPGTLPWWVRDCNSKVTGKVSVGHAGLRSTIATWPPRPS